MNHVIRKINICISCLMITFILFACSNSLNSKAVSNDGIIKIGVFEPQTGISSDCGLEELYGIRYANKLYNKIVIGEKEYSIKLVEVDNKSNKQDAVGAAQKLIGEKVDIVIGSYDSNMSNAVAGQFRDAKIPAIACSCTNPQVTNGNGYYFRICYMDPFETTVLASYAKKHGYSKAAVIVESNNEYSIDICKYFIRACEKYGIDIVANENVDSDVQNYNVALSNIKLTNPQVIFAPINLKSAALLINEAHELGIEAQFIGSNIWDNRYLVENSKESAEGIAITTFYNTGNNNREENIFLNGTNGISGFPMYLSTLGLSSEIHSVSALGYDAYLTAYKVLEETLKHYDDSNYKGPIKSDDVISVMHSINVDGVTGNISFDLNGDLNRNTAYIKEISNGKFSLQEIINVD